MSKAQEEKGKLLLVSLSSLKARTFFFNSYEPLKINRGGFGSGERIDGLWIVSGATPPVL